MAAASIFLAHHLLVFLVLAGTAWVTGRLLLRWRGSGWSWESEALAVAMGLAAWAQALLLLGLVGGLRRVALGTLLVVVHLLGAGEWRRALPAAAAAWRTWPLRRRVVAGVAGALVFAPLFLAALYPPIAFDETLYHLPFARAFAASGGVPYLPLLRVPVFPQLADLVFAATLLLAGDVATHLVSLLCVLATAALVVGWGDRAHGAPAGALAGALVLGTPLVVYLASTAYVDATLMLLVTAGLCVLDRWRGEGDRRWLWTSAALLATAASVKYLGLFFVATGTLYVLLSSRSGRRVRDAASFALVTVLALAPSYGRILWYTGNPIFPFLPGVFGHSAWDPTPDGGGVVDNLTAAFRLPWEAGPVGATTLSGHLLAALRLPRDAIWHRAAVGGMPPLAPWFVLALPLALVLAWRETRGRWLLLACFLYTLAIPANARYFVVVLPALALLGAGGAVSLTRGRAGRGRWASTAGAVAVALLLLPGPAYGFFERLRYGPLPVTPAAREAFLLRRQPVYAAVRFLNERRGSGYVAYGLYSEDLNYFAHGTLRGDFGGPASYRRVLAEAGDARRLHATLRGLGVEYLLIAVERGPFRLPQSAEYAARFREIYRDASAVVFELAAESPPASP